MADIKDQLIKDSYNYVLQSDLGTGIVYRIGGAIPVNPVFQLGLTVNDSFTYSNGTEGVGYALLTDGSGYAYWGPISAATPSSGVTSVTGIDGIAALPTTGNVVLSFTGTSDLSNYFLPLSGGTVTGLTVFNSGVDIDSLTAYTSVFQNITVNGQTDLNTLQVLSTSIFDDVVSIYSNLNVSQTIYTDTISATTYLNYPDSYVTGFSLNNNTITLTQNRLDQYSSFTISLSAYTGTSITGLYLPLSGGTLTGGLVANSGVTANTITQVNYIDFNTGTTNPSQTGGRVFFDNTSKALSYYDIANNLVPIAMGQQLYTRVYNATGAQIDKGKVIAITGTSNSLPSAILAVNTHQITSSRPIGLAAENIPSGSEGLVLNNGILSGITLNTFANGDTLYLSDTVPGGYVSSTSSLSFTARTNEIGYVLQTGSTTGKIYVNINNEDSNLTLTDIERNILEGNVISSGVYQYTGMTQGTGQTINVALARGWVVRNTYEFATLPDVTNVYYTGGTNIPLTYLNSADSTYILITSASTLLQQTTFPTPQQRRENIFLGKVVHPNRSTITSLNQTVDFDVSPMAAIRDLWTPLKLINQGVIVSANGPNMNINTSAGTLWGNGIGWTTNQQNPDSISISGTSPTTFQYRTRNGPITGGTVATGNTTTIDPAYYDLNGVITAVGGGANSSTNQRVYLFPTGLVRIQLGQKVYGTLAEAVAGVQTEQFVEYSNNRDNGILIGILSLNKNASVGNGGLVNTSYAVFNFVSKFGEVLGGTGGISTTTLQQAYDNSTTPEIVINAALDGLSIKNGTGNPDSTTNLLEGLNSGGTTTSFIRADGTFSGSSFYGNGGNLTHVFNSVHINGTPQFSAGTNTFINFSGINVNIISGANNTLIFSAGTGGSSGSSGFDVYVTGGTYNGSQILFTNNSGGTFTVTGLTATGFSANYYGSFSDSTNQPVSGANIATLWKYNTTEISNGISVVDGTKITVQNKGVYEIGYSPQIEKTQGTNANVTIWAAINGNPVTRSSSTLGLVSNSVLQLPFVSFIFELNAGDYVEFYFSSDNQYVQLTSISGLTTPTRPDSPSVIIVAKQVGLSTSIGGTGDTFVTGFSLSNNTITLSQNRTDQYSAFTISLSAYTGTSLSGNYLPLSGGTVTGGTQFTVGLTANTISATTYQNLPVSGLTEGNNISITGTNGNYTISFTGTTGSNFTGGTVSGATNFTNGLTANTISATTITATNYINLPSQSGTGVSSISYAPTTGIFTLTKNDTTTLTAGTFTYLTGATYSNNDITFTNNLNNSTNVNINNLTGLTINGNLTVTGNTSLQSLTATTISATTYLNLPTDIRTTGATYSNNTFTFTNNTGGTYSVFFNTLTGITVNGVLTVTGNTSLQNLTANTISAATYQNLPLDVFVTGGTYTSGSITFSNNSGGTFTVTGLPIGGQGGQVYYFNTSVTQTPYKEFGPTGTSASEQTTTISVASGVTSTIESYLTPVGYPNSILIPGGVWSFYLHTYKQDILSSFDVYCDVYLKTSGSTDYLFSTDPFDVTSVTSTPSMGISDGYFSGRTINTNDRILVLVKATNTGVLTKSITFVTEGTAHYSYGITTFTNLPANVSSLNATDGISGNATTGAVTIVNTDKGSSQNIFKNVQINGNTQFSASSNNSNLNFSGVGLTITSGANNTLIFSATPGGVTSIIANTSDGISASSSTGAVTLINTRPQGITGITATDGLSANTTSFLTTVINTDKGSSQNIFKNIQIGGITQFSATSNNSTLNFSGVNISIISASTNTLVFSAGTGGGGGLAYYISGSTPGGIINSGDRWFDTNSGLELVYINDVDSSQWIQPNSSPGSFTGNTASNCISQLYVTNVYGCSPINFNDPVNLKEGATFSGTTTFNGPVNINSGFTSNSIIVTAATINGNLTVTGNTSLQGLTATTISATTYQNLPTDIRTTGGTYSNNTFTFTNNTGGTYSVLFNTVTGLTVNGGLTVTGNTSAQGLTATTISATTYQNLPTDIRTTGGTYSNNTFTFTNNTGGTYSVLFNTLTGLTVNGGLTITGNTSAQGLTATTISATTYQNLPIKYYAEFSAAPTNSPVVLSTGSISIGDGAQARDTYMLSFGQNSGRNATGTTYSNFIGVNAGYDASGSSYSNFIGSGAGYGAINTSQSIFIGASSGFFSTGVTQSFFVGNESGRQSVNLNYSNVFGYQAGYGVTSATYVNFFGNQAGYQATSAQFSNFIGFAAGTSATNAQYSNFIGANAGLQASNASYSTLIGFNAGKFFTSNNIGSNNIIIGTNISLPSGTTNSLNIGGVLFGTGLYSTTGGNPSITGVGGKIGINVVNPTNTLDIGGSLLVTGTTFLGNGTFTKAGNAAGDILLDNSSTDTPGVLFYYANNSNYGIDSWNGSFDVLSGQLFRVTNKLNETGGAVKMAVDTSGNLVMTGFIKANAWRAGQVVNDIMLSNTEVTISTTTIATSNTDTDFLTYSYTPLSSSSYLVIHYHLADYSFASGTGNDSYFSRIKIDGNEITYSKQSTVNGNRSGVLFPLTGRYTNSNTTAKSVVVACRRDSADDSITIVNTATSMWLRITEIAR